MGTGFVNLKVYFQTFCGGGLSYLTLPGCVFNHSSDILVLISHLIHTDSLCAWDFGAKDMFVCVVTRYQITEKLEGYV